MTGFGEAVAESDGLRIRVETRTINSRYLKVSIRSNESIGACEPKIEAAVRRRIRRGTVQVSVRIEREPNPDDFRIHGEILAAYWDRIQELAKAGRIVPPQTVEPLLALPGVVTETSSENQTGESLWPALEPALAEALERLDQMRRTEGEAMASDLRENCRRIAEHLAHVEALAPQVVENYRERLIERVNRILAEHDVTVEAGDIVRELALFTDRCDISEEIVRLKSHLDQFDKHMHGREVSGRKLDFLTQEMVREVNTIGSKANNAGITQHVVEMKAIVERIREMVQNVE